MPVYVKIDEYKGVLDVVNLIKAKIKQARDIIGKINDLKNEEDSELNVWESSLTEIEDKIGYIDKTLFEPAKI